jgi:hypothetical protein
MALYGSDFWSDPKETDRREDLQPLVNQHARKQQFTARLANTCGGLKLMKVPDYHISDAPICTVIMTEHV